MGYGYRRFIVVAKKQKKKKEPRLTVALRQDEALPSNSYILPLLFVTLHKCHTASCIGTELTFDINCVLQIRPI